MSVVIGSTPNLDRPLPEQKKPEPGTQLQVRAQQLGEKALAVKTITTPEEFKAANELFLAQTALIKETEAFFKDLKGPAYQSWQNLCKRETDIKGAAEQGKKHIARLITGYQDEQESLRLQEEAKQRTASAQQSQDGVIEEAIALEAEGNIEGALAALDAGPGFIPAPTVARSVEKFKGVINRETWKARLKGSSRNESVDPGKMTQDELKTFMELVKAVAAGTVPIVALIPNWSFLNAQAKSMKKLLSYPGIEAYPDKGLSGRT